MPCRAGEPVGFEGSGRALQEYLVEKATAERLNIRTLANFSRPEMAAPFDTNDNGKAHLIGGNQGWVCAEVIDYHLSGAGAVV